MAAVAKSISIVLGMNTTQADRVSKNFFSALRTAARTSADNITGAFDKVLDHFNKGEMDARQYGNAIGALQLKFEKLGEEQIKLGEAAKRYEQFGSLPYTQQKEEAEKARQAVERLRKEQERLVTLGERIRNRARPGEVLSTGIGDVRRLLGENQISRSDAADAIRRLRREYQDATGITERYNERVREGARLEADRARRQQAAADALAQTAARIRGQARPSESLASGIGTVRGLLGSGDISRSDAADAIRRLRREYQDATGITQQYTQSIRDSQRAEEERARRQQVISDNIIRNLRAEADARQRIVQNQRDARRASADRINDAFQRSDPTANFNRDLRAVQRLVGTGQVSPEAAALEIRRLRSVLRDAQRGLFDFQGVVSSFKNSIFGFLAPIAVIYKVTEAFQRMIQLTADLQRNTASIEVFTRSLAQAKSIIAELRELSATSPVNFEMSQKAVRTLLQFGTQQELAVPFIKQISEITGGDTERFDKLALAFAQTQAAGRLMGQELLQMVNAGFNPLQEISLRTGRSMAELKKAMEGGEISANQVALAFRSATAEGGRFDGLLEKLADTTFGQLQKLQSNWDKLLTTIGESGGGPINSFFKGLNKDLERTNALMKNIGGSPQGIFDAGVVGKIFGPVGMTVEYFLNRQEEARKSQRLVEIELEKELEDLVVRRRLGDNTLTKEQIRLADEEIKRKRQLQLLEKRVTDDQAKQFAARLDVGLKVGNPLDFEKQAALRDKIGGGFFSQAENQLLDDYLEKTKELQQLTARIDSSFKDLSQGERDRSLDLTYGKEQAGLLLAVLEASTAEERKKLNVLIEQRKTYREIIAAANPAVATRATEIEKQIRGNNLDERVKKLNDERSLIGLTGKDLLTEQFKQEGFTEEEAGKLAFSKENNLFSRELRSLVDREWLIGGSAKDRFASDLEAKGLSTESASFLANRKVGIDSDERINALDKELKYYENLAKSGKAFADAQQLATREGIELGQAQLEIQKQLSVEFSKKKSGLEEQIQYERDLLNFGKERARLEQLGREGFSPDDAGELASKESELERLRNRNALNTKAEDLIKNLNPQNDFIEQMAELNSMFATGAGNMTQDQYNQAREQLLASQAANNSPQLSAPGAAVQGSQEVARIIAEYEAGVANQQMQVQQRIAIAAETQAEIARRTNEKLDKLIDKQPFVRKGP